jgi:SAM-dependent methyltransferase
LWFWHKRGDELREAIVSYVKWVIERYPLEGPVLDTCAGWEPNLYEPLFPGYEYIKQDMQDYDPTCIDIICDVCDMKSISDSSIGVVLNMESLEHIAYPEKAVDEIYRVLKPDGFLILTTVMHFKIHRTPKDYWRFAPDGLELLLKRFKIVDCTLEGGFKRPKGIWVAARKVLEGEGLGKLPEIRAVKSDDWILKKLERRIQRGLERIRVKYPSVQG